jgi:hypothetical protein
MGKLSEKKLGNVRADPELTAKVKAAAAGGRLSCAEALGLARELKVPAIKIGEACDAAGIKLHSCQLGCFN